MRDIHEPALEQRFSLKPLKTLMTYLYSLIVERWSNTQSILLRIWDLSRALLLDDSKIN
ncbi:uncharacterized protein PHALS_11493 [Plasmopara halstedii]|uniref:Uncharacterized protein n=1 Tax=Plasmopara halstedii TaxID=4781 RepID=A0A0P1A652_PLAHL|nr:uncharacterized protein PHALS_11493 [Plasmopara halstedii]CEG35622.1 hypothetical protein PHALS_11493 [Plasmopara halstedii]|eukprot:XP_024571991.1 hypothetical protein PHALS_11493 [Plasmopara halstedii]